MRLLNDLLNLHDGFDDEGWMKECKKRMVNTFPREDPFSILVPTGFDIDKVISEIRNCMDFDIIFLKCFDRQNHDFIFLTHNSDDLPVVKFHVICPHIFLNINSSWFKDSISTESPYFSLGINLSCFFTDTGKF